MQIFTCRCEMISLGGMHREQNLLAEFRRDNPVPLLQLSGGTTFIGDPVELGNPPAKDLKELRRLTVRGMNKLGTDVYGVAGGDLALAEEELAALASEAKFPFVAANVKTTQGKLKIQPFVQKVVNGQPFFITAVVPKDTQSISDYQVSDPVAALETVLSQPRPTNAIVIVMAEETADVRRAQAAKVSSVNLWLGAPAQMPKETVDEQYTDTTIFVSPAPQGRSVARVLLEPVGTGTAAKPVLTAPFYVEAAKQALAGKSGKLPPELKARVARVAKTSETATHRFKLSMPSIGRNYEEPSNELSAVEKKAKRVLGFE